MSATKPAGASSTAAAAAAAAAAPVSNPVPNALIAGAAAAPTPADQNTRLVAPGLFRRMGVGGALRLTSLRASNLQRMQLRANALAKEAEKHAGPIATYNRILSAFIARGLPEDQNKLEELRLFSHLNKDVQKYLIASKRAALRNDLCISHLAPPKVEIAMFEEVMNGSTVMKAYQNGQAKIAQGEAEFQKIMQAFERNRESFERMAKENDAAKQESASKTAALGSHPSLSGLGVAYNAAYPPAAGAGKDANKPSAGAAAAAGAAAVAVASAGSVDDEAMVREYMHYQDRMARIGSMPISEKERSLKSYALFKTLGAATRQMIIAEAANPMQTTLLTMLDKGASPEEALMKGVMMIMEQNPELLSGVGSAPKRSAAAPKAATAAAAASGGSGSMGSALAKTAAASAVSKEQAVIDVEIERYEDELRRISNLSMEPLEKQYEQLKATAGLRKAVMEHLAAIKIAEGKVMDAKILSMFLEGKSVDEVLAHCLAASEAPAPAPVARLVNAAAPRMTDMYRGGGAVDFQDFECDGDRKRDF